MRFANARTAILFAFFIGVAAAATLIAYAGSEHVDPRSAARPALMSIPF